MTVEELKIKCSKYFSLKRNRKQKFSQCIAYLSLVDVTVTSWVVLAY